MEIGAIVIIILVVINVVAFASAVWVSYDTWGKEGRRDWTTPMMGLFFIPLCLIIAVGWPIAKLRDYRKERKRKELIEESKKFHFQKFAFRLKGLPFTPSSNEVIFVENGYNERFNNLIQRNLEFIQDCFDKNEFAKPHFIYLPNLAERLLQEKQAVNYLAPYSEDNYLFDDLSLRSSILLDYMLVPENRSKIVPCFARYRGEESGNLLFECIGFDPEEDIDEKKFFQALCSAFSYYPKPMGRAYQKVKPKEGVGADERFEKDSKQLISEVEERIYKLRKMGISQWALEQLVRPKMRLSKLVITKDYRIFLPDYHDMEIKMEPINKAVYLLFLRHPDGIIFKHLPDYRKELAEIYQMIKPLGLNDRVIRSIEDVTNPCLNSINEKCARIRGAFISQFDDSLARHYYIYGVRGEAKKISLPRDLVVWEE